MSENAQPASPAAAPATKPPRDLRQELTDKLVKSLEQGRIPWNKPWNAMPGLPRNIESGREYRGGNRLMLMLEQADRGFTDPRYGTIKQINALGGRVKKGEHGLPVELWKEQPFYDRKDVSVTLNAMRVKVFAEKNGIAIVGMPTDKTGTLRVKTSELRVEQRTKDGPRELSWADARKLDTWASRVHIVFNVAQCEGLKIEPLGPAPNFDPVARGESIKAAMAKDGLKFAEHPQYAFYSPKRDEVFLPPRGAFNSEPGKDDGASRYYGTLLHEIGHATGAAHRLNRDGITGGHRFGSEGYAKEELRAEMFSMFIAAQTGIPHDAERHTAYVQDWAKVLKNDKNEIFRAAAEASKAVDYVLGKEQSLLITQERQASAKAAELSAQGEVKQDKQPGLPGVSAPASGREGLRRGAGMREKRAGDLRPGDRIFERIPGHAAFADRVDDVRFLKDGLVHVDLNNGTATRIYPESEKVLVVPKAQELAVNPDGDKPERVERPRLRQTNRKAAAVER